MTQQADSILTYQNKRSKSPFRDSGSPLKVSELQPGWNRHQNCCLDDNQTLLRAELNQNRIKLTKANEQLENKKKKIAELTQEVQLMKDKTWR